VPTGERTGIDVLDIDPAGGVWLSKHRHRLPETRSHQTRRQGIHFLFRHKRGLRSSVGRVALGVDIRADGGYVIGWPGLGLPVLSNAAVAPWPEWLISHLPLGNGVGVRPSLSLNASDPPPLVEKDGQRARERREARFANAALYRAMGIFSSRDLAPAITR